MMSFNVIDLLLLLLVLVNVWIGWQRGFILGLLDLVRWIASFLAALFFYRPVAGWIAPLTGWTELWNQPLAFLLVVFGVSVVIQIIGAALLGRIPKKVHEHRANHAFGILPGVVNGLITAALVAALLFALPLSGDFQESLRASESANRLAGYTDELEARLAPIFAEPLQQTLNRRQTVEPGSKESVELPFQTATFRPRPDLEAEMIELVNRERAANGLSPVAADPEMAEVARRHSADMFERGYFSHNTPEGTDPFARMRAGGVTFRTAGENLALAPTLAIAHNGLMNSPGHRANILRPQFGRLGIGVLDGGRYGLMITQNFRN